MLLRWNFFYAKTFFFYDTEKLIKITYPKLDDGFRFEFFVWWWIDFTIFIYQIVDIWNAMLFHENFKSWIISFVYETMTNQYEKFMMSPEF